MYILKLKGASGMDRKRWTLGVVLAAAVGLWGLVEADASPFSSYILSDDLGNVVSGTAPGASEWGDESGSADGSSSDDGSGTVDDSGSSGGDTVTDGKGNNGHGNNADGVDSSNPSNGHGGPNGAVDESCDGTGTCVDDEITTGGGSTSTDSSTTTSTTTAKRRARTSNLSSG
jgi:hypothetical protein